MSPLTGLELARSGKLLTCHADWLRRKAMEAKAQGRRKRLGFLSPLDRWLKTLANDNQFGEAGLTKKLVTTVPIMS